MSFNRAIGRLKFISRGAVAKLVEVPVDQASEYETAIADELIAMRASIVDHWIDSRSPDGRAISAPPQQFRPGRPVCACCVTGRRCFATR